MQEYKIYGLKDPTDNTIKYIGLTKNVISRYKQHFYEDFSNNKSRWIQDLKSNNLRPELIILETFITDDRNFALNKEKHYIKLYKDQLHNTMHTFEPLDEEKIKKNLQENFTTLMIKKELKNELEQIAMLQSIKLSYPQVIKMLIDYYHKSEGKIQNELFKDTDI